MYVDVFQHTLAKLYIEILGLGKDSPSAQKLLNFRAPKSAKGVSNCLVVRLGHHHQRSLKVL